MKTIYTVFFMLCFSFHSYASFTTCSSYGSKENSYASGDSTNIPLAVILLDFQATLTSEEMVKLTWITASEKNSQVFVIERSSDGIHFEAINQMKSAENSCHILQYSFTDAIVSYSQVYYRLKQVDLKGHIFYSKVVEAYAKANTMALKY